MVEKIKASKAWKRREEILQIFESLGTIHISKTELAKKYDVSVEQIRKDFIALSDKISRIDKKSLAFRVNLIFDFSINELLKKARNDKLGPSDQIKAIHELLFAADKKIDNLIKLGLIAPVEENLNVKHSVNSELYEKVIKVARRLRERKGNGRNAPDKS